MVIDCLVDLLLADQDTFSTTIVRNMMMIIKYLHNQVFRRGCYQDENELNDFSIASLGTNINYTDDDFYVFYNRRSQVTVKYWVKWT